MTKTLNGFLRWQRKTGAYGNIIKETNTYIVTSPDPSFTAPRAKRAINSLTKELVRKKYYSNKKGDWTSKNR
jgi:hypothetical protein